MPNLLVPDLLACLPVLGMGMLGMGIGLAALITALRPRLMPQPIKVLARSNRRR